MPKAIPKRIIQTAKSKELTPIAKAAATNLRLLHPDWEFLFFDDDDIHRFVKVEFPQHIDIFRLFPKPIQRIDFFRYLAVHRLGGFYFDLDVFLSECLDDLVQQECIFPFEELTLSIYLRQKHNIDWELGNYGFGAAAGDMFLGAVIQNCIKAQKDRSWLMEMLADIPAPFRSDFEVLFTTGPGLLTRTYASIHAHREHVKILFPEDVCNEVNWHLFGRYGVHFMDGSWRDNGSLLRRKTTAWWEIRRRSRLLRDSLLLGADRPVL
jgi:hypothetical protein